jgi:hypothetical protein
MIITIQIYVTVYIYILQHYTIITFTIMQRGMAYILINRNNYISFAFTM